MDVKFLKDFLFKGRSPNAIKLGTIMTLGRCWVRPRGCHVVYCGRDGQVDHDAIQAVMEIDAASININAQSLGTNAKWHYVRRQVSGCGIESPDSPVCSVETDVNGDMRGEAPNSPGELMIEQLSGARLRLRWVYNPLNEAVSPAGFNVYQDSGDGFDFDNPVGLMRYARQRNFAWPSAQLEHGKLYRYIVRAYAVDGEIETEELNSRIVAAVADSQGPAAISGAAITWEEVV